MNKTIEVDIETALMELLNKYSVVPTFKFTLNSESPADTDKLDLRLGKELIHSPLTPHQVPLLTWRLKRKFNELKNIVKAEVVTKVCLLRFSVLSNKEDWSLETLLYRELDLVEYIMGSKIVSLNAVIIKDKTANIITSLENGILCSIEANVQLPPNTDFIERHEIIAQRGAASDLVIDTQISHSSLYLFTEEQKSQFLDYDMELFDYDSNQIDHIRAAFKIISCPSLIEIWRTQHQHLAGLINAIHQSNEEQKKIKIQSI